MYTYTRGRRYWPTPITLSFNITEAVAPATESSRRDIPFLSHEVTLFPVKGPTE